MTGAELIARLRDFKKVTVWDVRDAADRIEALTANLAKAVDALEYYAVEALPWEADDSLRARTTLAEIKGGNDAKSDL